MTAAAVVDTFADAGELAARLGLLPEAFEQLVARLEQAGLLDELLSCQWLVVADGRKPAEPHPRPPKPPPPPPPPPGQT